MFHRWNCLFVLVWFAGLFGPPAATGQQPGAGQQSGASEPRPQPAGPVAPQGPYKRIGQYAMGRIIDGDAHQAVDYVRDTLDELPDDPELHFLLAVALGRLGQLDEAARAMDRALQLGLPAERFLAGPRHLVQPLYDTARWQAFEQQFADRLIHGPMVGAVDDRSAQIWGRTAQPARLEVVAGTMPGEAHVRAIPADTAAQDDFTAIVRLDGLEPDTEYYFRVIVNGQQQPERYAFRTFPERGQPARFSIAFGGGAGWVPQHERMWTTIESFRPGALLLLGDNVYIDDPETPEMQRYCYYRRQSRPEFRTLVSRTPVFAIWDDHDFSTDDSWGGSSIDTPAWKRAVWNVFRQNWVNPAYGGGQPQPGVWFDFHIGDVHFIMLDGRYYRTDAGRHGGQGVPSPTMLGPVQLDWLKRTLAGSPATLKVLASPVPWDFRAKRGQPGLDTWRGYTEEREEVFSFIEQQKIEGVLLISADRHRSDAWKIERPDGYDFYEFSSSKLTNEHTHGSMPEAIFSYNQKNSFGRITFDTTASPPTATYDVITIDGEIVHSLTVDQSQLAFP